MADDQHATPSRADYTVKKGEVSLALYRKHVGPAPGQPPRPILFLVHGSSWDTFIAGRCTTYFLVPKFVP